MILLYNFQYILWIISEKTINYTIIFPYIKTKNCLNDLKIKMLVNVNLKKLVVVK